MNKRKLIITTLLFSSLMSINAAAQTDVHVLDVGQGLSVEFSIGPHPSYVYFSGITAVQDRTKPGAPAGKNLPGSIGAKGDKLRFPGSKKQGGSENFRYSAEKL